MIQLFGKFKMTPNAINYTKVHNIETLMETIISIKDTMNNEKLILLEDSNDVMGSVYGDNQSNNVTAIYDIVKRYATKLEESLDRVPATLSDVVSHLHSDTEDAKTNFVLSNIKQLHDLSDADLAQIKFSIAGYSVDVNPIEYLDVNGIIDTFYRLLNKPISQIDVDEFDNSKPEFINYVKHIAAPIKMSVTIPTDVDYRCFIHTKLRNMEPYSKEYNLTPEWLKRLEDNITDKTNYERYLTEETVRIKEFISDIYRFAQSVSNGKLLNDELLPDVSTNRANWLQSKLDNSAENFNFVKTYVVKLFELFTECVEIYLIAVIETCNAYKDKISDSVNVLRLAIGEAVPELREQVRQLANIQNESATYTIDFLSTLNESNSLLNNSMIGIQLINPIGVLNESVGVLHEAGANKSSIIAVLDSNRKKIIELTNKFTSVMASTCKDNKAWLAEIANFDTKLLSANNTLELETYPYWTAVSIMKGIKIPEYTEADDALLLNNDGMDYYVKYFKTLLPPSTSKNKTIDSASMKAVLRGGEKKIYKKYSLVKLFNGCLSVSNEYSGLTNRIKAENTNMSNKLSHCMNDASSMNESTLIYDGSFIDDIYCMALNEAIDGPTTTDDTDKRQTDEAKKTEKPEDKPSDTNSKPPDKLSAIKKYINICYGINSVRMDIIDEAYNTCVTLLDKCTKTHKVNANANKALKKDIKLQPNDNLKENTDKKPQTKPIDKIVNKK